MEARAVMLKIPTNSRLMAVVLSMLAAPAAGCGAAVGSFEDEAPGVEAADAVGASIGENVVVDCTAAKDAVAVRTCKLGSKDSCTVAATLQTTQVVKNSAVVKPVVGTSATHAGKTIHLLNAAEAKLLANLHHMKLLTTPSGALTATAFEYTAQGAPFVHSAPVAGVSVVTKASANASIARITKALTAAAASCQQFRVASTDGITPVDTGFICEKTAASPLLFCDGTQPEGVDYAVGPSSIVNGVEINFVKAGCGAFGYDLVNKGNSSVSVKSKISGVELQPSCNFGIAAQGDGYCDAAGIAGPVTLTYSGSVTRGSTTTSFSLPVKVRCSAP